MIFTFVMEGSQTLTVLTNEDFISDGDKTLSVMIDDISGPAISGLPLSLTIMDVDGKVTYPHAHCAFKQNRSEYKQTPCCRSKTPTVPPFVRFACILCEFVCDPSPLVRCFKEYNGKAQTIVDHIVK